MPERHPAALALLEFKSRGEEEIFILGRKRRLIETVRNKRVGLISKEERREGKKRKELVGERERGSSLNNKGKTMGPSEFYREGCSLLKSLRFHI